MIQILDALIVLVITGAIAILVIRTFNFLSLPSFAASLFVLGFSIRWLVLAADRFDPGWSYLTVESPNFVPMLVVGTLSMALMALGMLAFAPPPGGWAARVTFLRSPQPRFYALAALAVLILQFTLLAMAYGNILVAALRLSQRNFQGSATYAISLQVVEIPLAIFAVTEAYRAHKKLDLALCSLLLILMLIVDAIINGRESVIFGLFALALALRWLAGYRIGLAARAFGVLAGAGAAIGGLILRKASQGQDFTTAAGKLIEDSLRTISDALPLADLFASGIEYAHRIGHDYGYAVVTAFSVLVPRSFWPDKPLFLSQLIAQVIYRTDNTGIPPGLLGEGYIAFGWAGPLIYAPLFGAAVAGSERVVRRLRDPFLCCWLIYVGVALTLLTLRMGVQGGLIYLQISILYAPLAFSIDFIGRRASHPLTRVTGRMPSREAASGAH